MKILITGATGLVGQRLIEKLFELGHHNINILTRDLTKVHGKICFPVNAFHWDPSKNKIDEAAFDNVDCIIHLAGESVAGGRWSTKRKKDIFESRSSGSKLLMEVLKKLPPKQRRLISSSAIGIYGNCQDTILDESSPQADDFLAQVCKAWEKEIHSVVIDQLIVHSVRTGLVLSDRGGALEKMLPPFKAGVGGILGDGKHYMSWIHIDDLVNMFIHLLEGKGKEKVYNGVSPTAITNYEFTKALGKVLKRPTIFPLPKFALKIIFGEMASILTDSQRVVPQAFIDEGFNFEFPSIDQAFKDILGHEQSGEYKFTSYQWIDKQSDKVFEFFSNEKNLEQITPAYLQFKVLKKSTEEIRKGTIIDYKLKLKGIPLRWKSHIDQFEPGKYFVDEQLKGPYAKWVHTHNFLSFNDGTLIIDHVRYKLPLGLLGRIFAGFFVRKDIQQIFSYRRKVIDNIFT